jgi:hypothetical protein
MTYFAKGPFRERAARGVPEQLSRVTSRLRKAFLDLQTKDRRNLELFLFSKILFLCPPQSAQKGRSLPSQCTLETT